MTRPAAARRILDRWKREDEREDWARETAHAARPSGPERPAEGWRVVVTEIHGRRCFVCAQEISRGSITYLSKLRGKQRFHHPGRCHGVVRMLVERSHRAS